MQHFENVFASATSMYNHQEKKCTSHNALLPMEYFVQVMWGDYKR